MSSDKADKDVRWLRSVMDRHEGPLLRYAARILGDMDRARDVVQETFYRLLKSSRAPGEDHLAEWLFAVCRNRALDVGRKESRMVQLSEQREQSRPSTAPSPPAAAEQREAVDHVSAAVKALPVNQQEVLRLKFQNEFTYRQIAGITGLSVSHVGVLIHTALSTLRERFKAVGLIGRA